MNSHKEGVSGLANVDELADLFRSIDTDGNNLLDEGEVKQAMNDPQRPRHIRTELRAMYSAMRGRMKTITWAQFEERLTKRSDDETKGTHESICASNYYDAYAECHKIKMGGKEWAIMYDNETPYYVDVASGASVWNLEGVDSLEEMFNAIDIDGDGFLTIQELRMAQTTFKFNDDFR